MLGSIHQGYYFLDGELFLPALNSKISRLNRGVDFYPLEIFSKQNGDSNSVKNSESRDIKSLT